VKANPAVEDAMAFVPSGNMSYVMAKLKPRDERTVTADQFIDQLRPRLLLSVPGVMAFLQNPPPPRRQQRLRAG